MTACGEDSLFIDRRVQFVDVGALFELVVDIQEHVAHLLQERLGFEHGKVLLARHDAGIHSALDVVTGVFKRGREAADAVPVEKQLNVLVRLASGERDEQRRRNLIGVVVGLDGEVDLAGLVPIRLIVRNALDHSALGEMVYVFVDGRCQTINTLREFLDCRGIEREHLGIDL